LPSIKVAEYFINKYRKQPAIEDLGNGLMFTLTQYFHEQLFLMTLFYTKEGN